MAQTDLSWGAVQRTVGIIARTTVAEREMGIVSFFRGRYNAVRDVYRTQVRQRLDDLDNPIVRQAIETVRQMRRDDVTLMAAGVAYYAILSLFPLTLLMLGILRIFSDSETARANLENFFSVYLPDSVGFVDQISSQSAGVSGLLGVIGFFGLLWGGTAMLSALARAVNRAFGITDDRPFYKQRPLTILLGLGIIGAFALSLFGSAAIESVSNFSVPIIGELTWVQIFARFLPFAVSVATFTLIYKLLPNTTVKWSNVIPAALLAAFLFEAAKILFLVYLNRFASFEVYGGMALLVILLVWSYFSAMIVLIGAELVAVRRQMQAKGQGGGEVVSVRD